MATQVREADDVAIPGTGFTKAHQLFRESVRQFIDKEINKWELV